LTDDFRKLLGRRDGTHVDNELIDLAIFVEVHLIDRLKLLALNRFSRRSVEDIRSSMRRSVASRAATTASSKRGEAGKHTGAWVKIKLHQEQEVIGRIHRT
jgi:hypothetical protein